MPEAFAMFSPAREHCAHGNLLLLGEAPGEEEARQHKPFVGPSGKLLDELLSMVGLPREYWSATNVFSERPPGNDIKAWTLTKTELRKAGYPEQGRLPQLNKRYLHPSREAEVTRLREELAQLKPDLILCLGGTALWALTGDSRITQHRGSFFTLGDNDHTATALATFHPAMVLRQWDQRPIVWADLKKVRQWLDGTLPQPIRRTLWINPTLEEVSACFIRYARVHADVLGIDIETSPAAGQITTFAIGTASECICLPLWNPQTLPEMSHRHGDAPTEALYWRWIKRFCEDLPNPKVFQNGMYDMQWLLDNFDIRPSNVLHDTAILQHAMQPELPKDLGTLGSLYLNEPAWKFMRTSKDEAKADE